MLIRPPTRILEAKLRSSVRLIPALSHSSFLQPQQKLFKGDWIGVLEWPSLT